MMKPEIEFTDIFYALLVISFRSLEVSIFLVLFLIVVLMNENTLYVKINE